MLTINKKYKADIDKLKKVVEANSDAEMKIFRSICKELKINSDENDGDCLFDYIFNDCDFTVKFKK